MAEVVSRLIPAIVRTESRVIQHSADLTFDQDDEPSAPDPDHLDIPESEGLPLGRDSDSSGWGRFTSAMPPPYADTVDSIPPAASVLPLDFSQRSTAPVAVTVLDSAVVRPKDEPPSATRAMPGTSGSTPPRRSVLILAFGLGLLLAGLWLVTRSDGAHDPGVAGVGGSASGQEGLEPAVVEGGGTAPMEDKLMAQSDVDVDSSTPSPTEPRRTSERRPVTPRPTVASSPPTPEPTLSPPPAVDPTPETVSGPEPTPGAAPGPEPTPEAVSGPEPTPEAVPGPEPTPEAVPGPGTTPAPTPESTPPPHQPGPIVVGNVTGTFARIYVDDIKVSGYTRDGPFESAPLPGGPHVVKLVCGGENPEVFRVVVDGRTVVTPCWDCEKMTPCDASP